MDFDILLRLFLKAIAIIAFVLSLPILWPLYLGIIIWSGVEKYCGDLDELDTLEQSGVIIIFMFCVVANFLYVNWLAG